MNTGHRVQAKANGQRGTVTSVEQGHSFTIRYDASRDERGRKVRGLLVRYPWHRAGAFNSSKRIPGVQDG